MSSGYSSFETFLFGIIFSFETQENVHRLDAEALKNREVIYIDIASKKIPKSENQADIQEFK